MTVIFYGGAFDPLTRGHEAVIRELWHPWNKVVIGILSDDGYKHTRLSFGDRWKLVNDYCTMLSSEMAESPEWMLVNQNTRTWPFLQSRLPDVDTIVVGTDEMVELLGRAWMYAEQLIRTYKILVMPRNDDISSTRVRELLDRGASDDVLLKYVSKAVLNTIREKHEQDN